MYCLGQSRHLKIVPQSDKIICTKSYEVIKVELFSVDDDGEILGFDFSPVFLDREGAVDIVGPSSLTLTAGRGAFYIKSLIEGKGSVSVFCNGETEVLDMEVIYGQMERL